MVLLIPLPLPHHSVGNHSRRFPEERCVSGEVTLVASSTCTPAAMRIPAGPDLNAANKLAKIVRNKIDQNGGDMGREDTKLIQYLSIWLVIIALLSHAVGFIFLARFLPPTPPSRDASYVASFYHENTTGIMVTCVLVTFVGPLIIPFFGVISVQLKRIQRNNSSLAYTQLMSGAIGASMFALSAMLWAAAAFRPDRTAQEILLLSDMGWIFFMMPGPFAITQLGAIGLGILMDRSHDPIYPRWLGYQNLGTALLLVPTACVAMFRTGPFAWNGLIAFWVPAALFHIWFISMLVFTFKAIRKPHAAVLEPES